MGDKGVFIPRRADDNQQAIVTRLRNHGYTVLILHMVGRGCPDILVGVGTPHLRVNILMEIKNGNKVPSARKLTDLECLFLARWRGNVVVVESPEEALEVAREVRKGNYKILDDPRFKRPEEINDFLLRRRR